MFNKEEIIDYANKLLIGLTDEEANMILDEFSLIDKNIEQINEIEGLKSYDATFTPFDLYTATLREDIEEKGVDVDIALANTKDKLGREVKVPKVVE